MAFGDIRGTKTGNGTSVVAASPCATGTNFTVAVDDIVVALFAEQTAVTVTACADNLTNTYAAFGAGLDAGTVTGRAFWTRVTNAGVISSLTFTATASTNNYACLAVGFEGPFATSPIDAAPAGILNDNTTPYACPPTGVLAQANEKIVCAIVHTGNPTLTATAPNLKAIDVATASILKAAIGHQTVTSTASVTPSWTSSAAPTASAYDTVSFKQGPASGTLVDTEGPDVASMGGAVEWPPITGELADVEAADSGVFDGDVASAADIDAVLAAIDAIDTANATGVVGLIGTLAASDVADTCNAGGLVGRLGTFAATDIADAANLSASVRWLATLAASEATDTAANTGTVQWFGTLAAIEAPDIAVIAGPIPATGVVAAVEQADAAALAASAWHTATLAATDAADHVVIAAGLFADGVLAATDTVDFAAFVAGGFDTVGETKTYFITGRAAPSLAVTGSSKRSHTITGRAAPAVSIIGSIPAPEITAKRKPAPTWTAQQ